VAAAFEPWERKPYDLFFFEADGREYVGRKQPASFQTAEGTVSLKCALVAPEMVLGRHERVQVTEAGITVFHRPVDEAEAEAAFAAFAADPLADLHYPAPHLQPGARAERVAPPGYWTSAPARVQHLNVGEVFLREYTVGLFAGPELERARIYDPACSTGEFLAALKARVPSAWTIGQDLSGEMADLARGRLDEVHHGDCADSPVPDGSADLVFVRHLNVDVVTTRRAYELFVPVANRCRDGGRIVVFGHTPVLLASPWFEMLGLTVERRTGTLHGGRFAFQYYVLRKTRPLVWTSPFGSGEASAPEPAVPAGTGPEGVR
jgi:isonocardicin synthase